MKSVEFAAVADVSGAGSSTSNEDGGAHKSLEALLLEKNKTLQSEVTSLRVASADVTGACSSDVKNALIFMGRSLTCFLDQRIAILYGKNILVRWFTLSLFYGIKYITPALSAHSIRPRHISLVLLLVSVLRMYSSSSIDIKSVVRDIHGML